MLHYIRGECSLDAISVREAYVKGEQLNWSSYLLKELFEAYEDVHARARYFIFGYLVIPLAMLKWCPPEGRDLAPILDDELLTYAYALAKH